MQEVQTFILATNGIILIFTCTLLLLVLFTTCSTRSKQKKINGWFILTLLFGLASVGIQFVFRMSVPWAYSADFCKVMTLFSRLCYIWMTQFSIVFFWESLIIKEIFAYSRVSLTIATVSYFTIFSTLLVVLFERATLSKDEFCGETTGMTWGSILAYMTGVIFWLAGKVMCAREGLFYYSSTTYPVCIGIGCLFITCLLSLMVYVAPDLKNIEVLKMGILSIQDFEMMIRFACMMASSRCWIPPAIECIKEVAVMDDIVVVRVDSMDSVEVNSVCSTEDV